MAEAAERIEQEQPQDRPAPARGALYLGHHWRIQKGHAPTWVVAFRCDDRPDWYCAKMDARDEADAIELTLSRIVSARDPRVVPGQFELRPLAAPDKLPRLVRVEPDHEAEGEKAA